MWICCLRSVESVSRSPCLKQPHSRNWLNSTFTGSRYDQFSFYFPKPLTCSCLYAFTPAHTYSNIHVVQVNSSCVYLPPFRQFKNQCSCILLQSKAMVKALPSYWQTLTPPTLKRAKSPSFPGSNWVAMKALSLLLFRLACNPPSEWLFVILARSFSKKLWAGQSLTARSVYCILEFISGYSLYMY